MTKGSLHARVSLLALGVLAFHLSAFGVELTRGAFYSLEDLPAVLEAPLGVPVQFALEENATTGYRWEVESPTNACEVVLEHRAAAVVEGFAGAPGRLVVTVKSRQAKSPVRIIGKYRRSWEKDIPRWAGKAFEKYHLEGSFRLSYNASLFAKHGLGVLLTFDKLIDTSENSGLKAIPLKPELTTPMYLVWKKQQVFSPIAERFLSELQDKL